MVRKKNKLHPLFAKTQAALEFLITYGWAFLLVLVMIGALAHFGVLDPKTYIPDFCHSTGQLKCEDFFIGNGEGLHNLILLIKNDGPPINITQDSTYRIGVSGLKSCDPVTYLYIARDVRNWPQATPTRDFIQSSVNFAVTPTPKTSMTIPSQETFLIATGCAGSFSKNEHEQVDVTIPYKVSNEKLFRRDTFVISGKIDSYDLVVTTSGGYVWHLGDFEYHMTK